jgi:AcrR family transcriptional regulator
LVDAAARQFIERGYAAVSMQDVAGAAKLTKGAVYGHFRSKGQLLVEVVRHKIAERDALTDYTRVREDPPRAVQLMFDRAGREVRLLEVDAAAAARHDPEIAAGLVELYRERHAHIQAACGEVADPEVMALVVMILTLGIGLQESVGTPLPEPDRLRVAILAMLDALVTADRRSVPQLELELERR